MIARAGRITGDSIIGSSIIRDTGAAPYGEIGAMGAIAADLARAGDGIANGQLELRYQRATDGHAMVSAHGELDIATAGLAHAYLRTVLDSEKKGKVTLNLADLTFCDASGLGVLARLAVHARHTGRSLLIISPRPALVRIMRITGMDAAYPEISTTLLTMVPTPRQATVTAD